MVRYPVEHAGPKKLLNGKRHLPELILSTGYANLDLLPAEFSYRNFDVHLAERKTDLSNSLAYSNAAAESIADLLDQARPPFKNTVAQSDRADSIVLADRDYFDDFLNTLPDAYQALARQGMYGDFFTFYLCDIVLKLNGKGGQPVYIKLVGQPSGRCTPR